MWMRRAVLAVITAGVVLLAGGSLIRTIRGFYQLDFGVTWVEDGLRVDRVAPSSTGAVAGLRAEDHIASIDGKPVRRFSSPLFSLASGTEHQLLVKRGADEFALTFHPPKPAIDETYLARSLVGIFALVCAAMAAFLTRRRESTTFLLLASASLIIGTTPHRIAATATTLSILHRVAGTSMPFLLVRFFSLFPHERRRMRWWDMLTVVAVGVAGLSPVIPGLEGWWPPMIVGLRLAFSASLMFGIIVEVHRWWNAQEQERRRRQIEWVGLGLFVGLTPVAALIYVPDWLGIAFAPFSWLAILPLAAIPLTILAALTEYRLWDLEPIARDSVSATLVVTSGGFIFALANHLIQSFGAGLGNIRNLLAFATGVLVVILVGPVRRRVEPFLDQWLHHGRPSPRWLLTHSMRDLATAVDPRVLLTTLASTMADGLEISPVATFVRSERNGFHRVSPATDADIPDRLPGNLEELAFPHPAELPMASGGFTRRIPLERGGTTHGLVYLGLRRGSAPLGSEAGGVVAAFAAQAALGLENARRLDELRRQAEEYRILHANTQRIIESSEAGILVCDAGGRILSANTKAAGIFGLLARDLVGDPLQKHIVLPENWHPQLPLHAANAESRTITEPLIRLVLAVSVLELDSGSFNGRVVVLQDVTELRKLQDQVREQERLAGLGRLAAGLAHEINTPLTGIASYAQMLGATTPSDDPRAGLVHKLVNQSFRVSRIIANLLEFFRGQSGDRVPIDLAEAVRAAADEAVKSVEADVALEFAAPPAPVVAWASAGAISLAVTNLVRNATEACPAGSTVRVAVRDDGDDALVTIDDDGPGIPDELRDRVFQPFVTTKTDRGGTGLGLAITRDMISQIGGEVWLEDLPGGGTRAALRFEKCNHVPAS